MMFAIKAELQDPSAPLFVFTQQKTMYGGKRIAKGDRIFVFASKNKGEMEAESGVGLVAHGVVSMAVASPRLANVARQTPRVSINVQPSAWAQRHLGRSDLRPFSNWHDGRPETELNFKFYRQATDKIVGISDPTGAWLLEFFD
ncbi:hypothetical protein LNV09_00900 [Paucibacter sp. B2R-40]|uniref:hypothetical protein n=1 Tax=Paucibacter sp. B2R-40 TaxID=2893554 RepID=UPI0021E5094F|nr:hypothetical protein [Paucibacter sp. B2R-40]MCV2352711.1 hypothetical protein [Paucibacter sp. B2R-40]